MLSDMSSRERLTAAMTGGNKDRIPVCFGGGFGYRQKDVQPDDFLLGWQADSKYQRFKNDFSRYTDTLLPWEIYPMNRVLQVANGVIKYKADYKRTEDIIQRESYLDIPSGRLRMKSELHRNINTTWITEFFAKKKEDLREIAALPFTIDYDVIERQYLEYQEKLKLLGDDGLLITSFNSPIVVVSEAMDFEDFFVLTVTDNDFLHELLGMITDRYLQIAEAIFERHSYDTIVNLGGSEQCTDRKSTRLNSSH